MNTVTISEAEYRHMKNLIENLQKQLAIFQDVDFVQKLQTFLSLSIHFSTTSIVYLPITPAQKTENQEDSFGMWSDRPIDAQSLRQQAWGKRI